MNFQALQGRKDWPLSENALRTDGDKGGEEMRHSHAPWVGSKASGLLFGEWFGSGDTFTSK